MMMWTLIGIAVLFLGGLILLNGPGALRPKARPDALSELAKYYNGQIRLIEGKDNSFVVSFIFEGEQFVFEDIEQKGFGSNSSLKGFLKLNTGTLLSFTFSEKEKDGKVRSNIVMASQISDQINPADLRVKMPKDLQQFQLYTNHTSIMNDVLADVKILGIIRDFKNMDPRGFQSISLRMIDGVLVLEFQPLAYFRPSLQRLYESPSSLEKYLVSLVSFTSIVRQHNQSSKR